MGENRGIGSPGKDVDATVGPVRLVPETGRRAVLLSTATGGVIDLLNPDPNSIMLDDIAWALAHEGRWANQCRPWYSVAQHSIRVAARLCGRAGNKRLAAAGLLHDGLEFLLRDMGSPFKAVLSNYALYAVRLQDAIHRRFGLDPSDEGLRAIKFIDDSEMRIEALQLMPREFVMERMPEALYSAGEWIVPMTPDQAYKAFLDRAWRYGVKEIDVPNTERTP